MAYKYNIEIEEIQMKVDNLSEEELNEIIMCNLLKENEELKQKIELITENIRELLHKIDDLQKQK